MDGLNSCGCTELLLIKHEACCKVSEIKLFANTVFLITVVKLMISILLTIGIVLGSRHHSGNVRTLIYSIINSTFGKPFRSRYFKGERKIRLN